MNSNDKNIHTPEDELPDALRWQLRAMRRDVEPGSDLWPGIAGRLQAQRPKAATRPRWLAPVAMAATLVLAVGMVGVWRGGDVGDAPVGAPPRATLVQREAEGMTLQYQAALREVDVGQPPMELQPVFDDLDRSAGLILQALTRDPDSRLLLEQLRRTYARRLALAQRLVYA
ncbi:hypothetical protein AB4Y64_14560 [Lysobacter sp. TAF61]|uniref:hypothetical protein n=1 Tax=Lysobacter sp. TAF61 TaxID=3233072 RepID=UPI003F9EA4E2